MSRVLEAGPESDYVAHEDGDVSDPESDSDDEVYYPTRAAVSSGQAAGEASISSGTLGKEPELASSLAPTTSAPKATPNRFSGFNPNAASFSFTPKHELPATGPEAQQAKPNDELAFKELNDWRARADPMRDAVDEGYGGSNGMLPQAPAGRFNDDGYNSISQLAADSLAKKTVKTTDRTATVPPSLDESLDNAGRVHFQDAPTPSDGLASGAVNIVDNDLDDSDMQQDKGTSASGHLHSGVTETESQGTNETGGTGGGGLSHVEEALRRLIRPGVEEHGRTNAQQAAPAHNDQREHSDGSDAGTITQEDFYSSRDDKGENEGVFPFDATPRGPQRDVNTDCNISERPSFEQLASQSATPTWGNGAGTDRSSYRDESVHETSLLDHSGQPVGPGPIDTTSARAFSLSDQTTAFTPRSRELLGRLRDEWSLMRQRFFNLKQASITSPQGPTQEEFDATQREWQARLDAVNAKAELYFTGLESDWRAQFAAADAEHMQLKADGRALYQAYQKEIERSAELSAKLESARADCHQELGKQRVESGVELGELQKKYEDAKKEHDDLLRVFGRTVEQKNEAYEEVALIQRKLETNGEEVTQAKNRVAQLSRERPEVRPIIKENIELKGKNEALEREVVEARNILLTQQSFQAESLEWVTDAALAAGLDRVSVEVQDWVSTHVVNAPYCE